MKLVGLVRLGRDAEVRYTADGKPVATFSAAFNYGRRDGDSQPVQWVELTLWGDRAEKVAPHLAKGTSIVVFAGEPHIETFDKRDGTTGFKLVARVDDFTFAGRAEGERSEGAGQQRMTYAQQDSRARNTGGGKGAAPAPAAKSKTGFDDMDDDIPF